MHAPLSNTPTEAASPYGEVCGVAVRGTEQIGEKRVLFAVTLITDEGANTLPMRLAHDTSRTEIAWDGVSTLKFTAVLRSGNKVSGSFTCVHDASEGHSLELCVALTFPPHGWIRFERSPWSVHLGRSHSDHPCGRTGPRGLSIWVNPILTTPMRENRSTLLLNREDVLRLHIPLSIIEENMFRNALSMPDIERLYGMSLADKDRDRQGAVNVATYRELPWAKRQAVGQRALPSLARVREEKLKAEANLVSQTLEPKWRERVGMLVVSLLRNTRRTLEIIRRWHAYPMFQNRKPHEIWSLFMEAVLYSPLKLHITQTSLFLFQETALAIPLTWLNADERIIVTDMVVARKELFRSVSESRVTAQYSCKDFRLDGLLDKLVCRYLIVHLFVSDCVHRATLKDRERPTLLLVTIEAAGICYVKHKDSRFLFYLKRALEKRTVVQDLAQMGMYIKIGDCVPTYTYEAPDRTKPRRVPCWTPK